MKTHRRSRFLVVLTSIALTGLLACNGARKSTSSAGPAVTFDAPSENDTVHGVIAVHATATGAGGKIKSFTFDAPAALKETVAVLDDATRTATLTANLDLVTFQDGPLTLTVTATDEFGATTTMNRSVVVASAAPSITVTSPGAGSTIRGAVSVAAAATPHGTATITSLMLVDPPAGLSSNTASAPGLFTAVWDTTQAAEGPNSLHFRATDSTGLTANLTVNVTVDNRAPGDITACVSAGTAIKGANVTVYAIDDASGDTVTSVGVSGAIGAGGPTDDNGCAVISVSTESYSGPIRVTASGMGLVYVDPTQDPPVSPLGIPSDFVFESYLAHYQAGSSVTMPLTLWTTLADHAALALAKGKHPMHSGTHPLSYALEDTGAGRDQLFVRHITGNATAWAPASFRTTVPFFLTDASTTTLADRAYASLADTALNQLAHSLSVQAGWSASSRTINGITFVQQQLIPDLDADGQFDGKGASGAAITIVGAHAPLALDAQTLRVPMATALDDFISDRLANLSAITRSDLSNAGVFDTMSTDASDLFGALPSGAFDNTPPSCTISATYSIPGGPQAHGPVGASLFVGGVVTLTADCTDNSGSTGMASVSAAVGGQALVPLQGNTAKHFSGTWTTTADGPLTFTVTTRDTHNNTGTQSFTVRVDNTKPTLTPSASAPDASAYYTGSVPFDVTATDAGSGMASLTPQGFTGLTAPIPSVTHFSGTWTVPTATADGTVTGSFQACDNVGNCTASPVSVHVDQTPPTITLVSTPPSATNSSSLLIDVQALDGTGGSGVGAVNATINGGAVTPLQSQGNGIYRLTITPADGANQIQIWAVDRAVNALGASPNSGLSNGGSSYLARLPTIMGDHNAPAALYDAAFANYLDERNLSIARDADGNAIAPVQYSASGSRVPITVGGAIYKRSTRLAWSTTPSVSTLENSNPENIPAVRWNIPYDGATQAPVAVARYTVRATCSSGCSGVQVTGDLWRSATPNYFVLPFSSNLFPDLSTGQGPITLAVTLYIEDAAGNYTTTSTMNFTYHVIGAELGFAEDSSYATAGDSKSVYPYSLSGASYNVLFDSASSSVFAPEQLVRYKRYVITNPHPTALAVAPTLTNATWSIGETWTGDGQPLGAGTYSLDGFTFRASAQYKTSSSLCLAAGCGTTIAADPCVASGASGVPYHTAGDSSTQYLCANTGHSTAPGAISTSPSSGTLTTAGYLSNASPASKVGTSYVVPAAAGSTPGTLVLYVARVRNTARPIPLSYGKLNTSATTPSRYEVLVEDAWLQTATLNCYASSRNGCSSTGNYYYTYSDYRWIRFLSSASESASGSLAVDGYGIAQAGNAVIGEPSSVVSERSLSLSVTH